MANDRALMAHSARQLGRVADTGSIRVFESALDDGDFAVRCEAASALRSFPVELVRNALRRAVTDSDENVRICAIESITSLRDDVMVPELITCLVTGKRVERSNAAIADNGNQHWPHLGNFKWPHLHGLIEGIPIVDTENGAVEPTLRIGI